MIKSLIVLIGTFFLASSSGLAGENPSPEDWEGVEGVTVQSKERVEQIKAYEKKLKEAEKKRLKEGWESEGITVQSEERVRHLNELEKENREKEIREIKCKMCSMRCQLVRDAGQTTCNNPQVSSDDEPCLQNADNFMKSCLEQCDICRPSTEVPEP
ncbi:MAG: hypothetical protein ACU843_13505 [Gammaproteobacteria bacterium]